MRRVTAGTAQCSPPARMPSTAISHVVRRGAGQSAALGALPDCLMKRRQHGALSHALLASCTSCPGLVRGAVFPTPSVTAKHIAGRWPSSCLAIPVSAWDPTPPDADRHWDVRRWSQAGRDPAASQTQLHRLCSVSATDQPLVEGALFPFLSFSKEKTGDSRRGAAGQELSTQYGQRFAEECFL